MTDILFTISGAFYSVLCVFSIVTGLMYAGGKKELNPLELSDRFMSKYEDPEKRRKLTIRMGWVTVLVGVAQGVTAYAIFRAGSAAHYAIALGFTVFSIASVAFKLKGKINLFPVLKGIAYAAILVVLIVGRSAFHGTADDTVFCGRWDTRL